MIEIGKWVRRYREARSRWHYVESEIGTDVITRCGRRMALKSPGRRVLEFETDAFIRTPSRVWRPLCFYCDTL